MKLAQEPCYHEIITPEQFQLCALVINVSNYFYSWLKWFLEFFEFKVLTSELLLLLNWLFNIAHGSFRVFLKLQIFIIQHLLMLSKHVTPSFQLDVFHFYFVLNKIVMVAFLCFILLQDECYQVRQIFAQKLHKALVKLLLPLEYMAIFALCAKDPVKERRAHARQCLLKNISIRREYIKQNPMANG